jgi:hypothetical protein
VLTSLQVYIIGGSTANSTSISNVDVLYPHTNFTIFSGPGQLPDTRFQAASVSYDPAVITVVGGDPGGTVETINACPADRWGPNCLSGDAPCNFGYYSDPSQPGQCFPWSVSRTRADVCSAMLVLVSAPFRSFFSFFVSLCARCTLALHPLAPGTGVTRVCAVPAWLLDSPGMDPASCNGPCHGNGYCSFANGGTFCTCNTPAFNASTQCGDCVTGYAGKKCTECAPKFWGPTCAPCTCGVNGTCVDGKTGTGVCVCDTGFAGKDCTECAEGYFGSTCQPCQDCNKGRCFDVRDAPDVAAVVQLQLQLRGCACDGYGGAGCSNPLLSLLSLSLSR